MSPETNSSIPVNAVPINADVTKFDFLRLQQSQLKFGGRLFDVIMMDPPWQLSTSQPSRGVAIGYSSLADDYISKLPLPSLQNAGFLFIWYSLLNQGDQRKILLHLLFNEKVGLQAGR